MSPVGYSGLQLFLGPVGLDFLLLLAAARWARSLKPWSDFPLSAAACIRRASVDFIGDFFRGCFDISFTFQWVTVWRRPTHLAVRQPFLATRNLDI